jgi:predicted ATP-grasp superfamily ATP-dependent carboligase
MTIKKLSGKNICGFKLLIATVSTGNVGQLAADLLINSYKMEKYAIVSYFSIFSMNANFV